MGYLALALPCGFPRDTLFAPFWAEQDAVQAWRLAPKTSLVFLYITSHRTG
jgi:hypothetical protein